MSEKKILIFAGPNGAGKTTFAQEFLPNEAGCPIFVNADLIAASLAPLTPEVAAWKAGRLMLEEMKLHAAEGRSFGFETTLAGRGYVKLIRHWRKQGYVVKLFFLALNRPEEAIARVAARVKLGGHNVPDEVVIRRFHAGLRQFREVYQYEVDFWRWYDNSGDEWRLTGEGPNE